MLLPFLKLILRCKMLYIIPAVNVKLLTVGSSYFGRYTVIQQFLYIKYVCKCIYKHEKSE